MLDTVDLKDVDDGSDSDDAGEMPVFGRATIKRHSEAIIDEAIQEEIESQEILVVHGKKLDVPAKKTTDRLPTPSRNSGLAAEEPDEDSDDGEEDEQSFLDAQNKNAKVASQASAGAGVAKADAAVAVEAGAEAAYAAARAAPASVGVAASMPAGLGVARMRATPRSAGLQVAPRPTNVKG